MSKENTIPASQTSLRRLMREFSQIYLSFRTFFIKYDK
nr:MAG TPA: hypothetical protein [Caudoviricetes sp.]DAS61491.1 MAG TPA: hypothetical protein [Caudoviricetes sp.]